MLSERAQARIDAGTVSRTRYGWRVECRKEFGDGRSDAVAYWPELDEDKKKWKCACRAWRTSGGWNFGMCSHIYAVWLMCGYVS